jgi:hypothetical protein
MPAILYPHTFHFGQPHPDTVAPDGFALVADDRDFLCVREIGTGHLFMAEFTSEADPHHITRLTRYRLPTPEELARSPQLQGGRFILDRTERVLIAYDSAGAIAAIARQHALA